MAATCVTKASSTTYAIQIQDCESCWLPSDCRSEVRAMAAQVRGSWLNSQQLPAFHFHSFIIKLVFIEARHSYLSFVLTLMLTGNFKLVWVYVVLLVAYHIQTHHCHQCSLECYHSGQRKEYTDDCCKETLNRKLRWLQKTVHTINGSFFFHLGAYHNR